MWLNYWAVYQGKKFLRRADFLSSKHAWDCLRLWSGGDWIYFPAKDDEHLRVEHYIVQHLPWRY